MSEHPVDEAVEPEAPPPSPAAKPWSAGKVLLIGIGGMVAGLLASAALKALAESPWMQKGAMAEKQPLGWLPYFIAALGAACGLVFLLEVAVQVIRFLLPRTTINRWLSAGRIDLESRRNFATDGTPLPIPPARRALAAAVGLGTRLVVWLFVWVVSLVILLAPMAVVAAAFYAADAVLKHMAGRGV